MAVRAKFTLVSMHHRYVASPNDVNVAAQFEAVWGDGNGNREWSKATPSGKLEMVITNPQAIDQLILGAEYFLTIEKA